MSRTFKNPRTRNTEFKMEDKRVGYAFEQAYTQDSRNYVKRLINKHNRRVGKSIMQEEILHGIKETIYV